MKSYNKYILIAIILQSCCWWSSQASLQTVDTTFAYGQEIRDYTEYNGYSLINAEIAYNKDTKHIVSVDYQDKCDSVVHRNSKNELYCLFNGDLRVLQLNNQFQAEVVSVHPTGEPFKNLYKQDDLIYMTYVEQNYNVKFKVFNSTSNQFENEKSINPYQHYSLGGRGLAQHTIGKKGITIGERHLVNLIEVYIAYYYHPWSELFPSVKIDDYGLPGEGLYYIDELDSFCSASGSHAYNDVQRKKVDYKSKEWAYQQVTDNLFMWSNMDDQWRPQLQFVKGSYDNDTLNMELTGTPIPISFVGGPHSIPTNDPNKFIFRDDWFYYTYTLDVETNQVLEFKGSQWPPLKFSNGSIVYFTVNGQVIQNPDGTFANYQNLEFDYGFEYYIDIKNPNIVYGCWYGRYASVSHSYCKVFDSESSTISEFQAPSSASYSTIEKLEGDENYYYTYFSFYSSERVAIFVVNNTNIASKFSIPFADPSTVDFYYNSTANSLLVLSQTTSQEATLFNFDLTGNGPNTTTNFSWSSQDFSHLGYDYWATFNSDRSGVEVFEISTQQVIQTIQLVSNGTRGSFVPLGFDESKYPNVLGAIAYCTHDNKTMISDENGGHSSIDYFQQGSNQVELQRINDNEFRIISPKLPLNLEVTYQYTRDTWEELEQTEFDMEMEAEFLPYIYV